jgi:methyl-accepting chemotaxis protein
MPSEKIKLIIDVVTGQSSSALKKLSSDLKATETTFGKMKVAGSAGLDMIKQNAGLIAAGAGAAIAGFAAKAVGDFQSVALATGEFRDATGLAAEEASRFIEVGKDLGIPVETLQGALNRLNRAAADTPGAFDEIGAAIQRNRDGTVDVNETFLATIDALNGIPDPAQRAARAQELFGRGWQQIAELIGMGAEEVRAALDSVEAGKLKTDDDVAQARQFRDQLDELRGVVESVTQSVGEGLVPVLSDLVGIMQSVGGVVGLLPDPPDWLTTAAKWMTPIGPIEKINDGLNNLRGNFEATYTGATKAQNAATELAAADEELAAVTELAAAKVDRLQAANESATTAAERAAEAYLADSPGTRCGSACSDARKGAGQAVNRRRRVALLEQTRRRPGRQW